ncbi:sensor kinase HydH [Legionella rubrilucens]|uniref:histidine kinase n=1 Tax=Legionella rubrilucens TaxID=458 RepID=A0A0W0XW57_9GAMM|nr:ATP-binding protein [Legionella rubrilucens]KTD48777.1 sensor kinase HydH [Legionella rubrilucens]
MSTVIDRQNQRPFTLSEKEILGCLPCGLIVLNTQGLIVWLNQAASHLLGGDLRGELWLDVINRVFSPRADDGHEVSLVDGRRVNVAISSLESVPGQLVTLIDLTTTRDYEDAKANQDRLMMIGRMTAQLAHQIRTPLASARLYTDHLQQQVTDERCLQWLSRLQDCHASIEQQIADLLLFARGEALVLAPTDLRQWSYRFLERVYTLLDNQKIKLEINNRLPPALWRLHSESLIGALLNLINNSLQAEADALKITLQLQEGEGVTIQIEDNGLGLSEESKRQAFTPFFTTKAQGTGLGLAVVQAVVKAHGGQVMLASTPGQGCCVTIHLVE